MKRILSLATSLLVASALYAQNDPKLPEVVPPSPTVANLMKFEEVPINNYSGQPNISIPLFSKQIGKGIGFNLALSYATSGVQIDNVSGWTGTGWSLFAGGTISRTVRDVADETQKGIPLAHNKTGILHNTNYWNYDNLSYNFQEQFKWRVMGTTTDKYDNQLDLYQFNFMGYSGRFVIVKGNFGVLEAKLISRNVPFEIEITNDATYKVSKFTVKDANGYSYIFDVSEEATYHSSNESTQQGTSQSNSGTSSSYTAQTAWHLREVRNTKDLVLATFNYTALGVINEGHTSTINKTYNRIVDIGSYMHVLLQNPYNLGVLKPKIAISQTVTTTKTRKLTSVVFRDNSKVDFLTSALHPENGGVKLDHLVLKDVNNTEYKRYTLGYQTLNNRLWLTKVSEVAGGVSLDTDLNYHNPSLLPERDVATDQDDSWGYYSGIDERHSLLNPFDANQIKTGLLTSIEYPTGGVKEFNYEHNRYSYVGDALISYDNYMKNPLNHTINTASATNFTYSNPPPPPGNFPEIPIYNNATPQPNPDFTLDFKQDIYISSTVSQDLGNNQDEHEIWIQDTSGNMYGRADLGATNVLIPNLPSGAYKFFFANKGNETPFIYQITMGTVTVEYKKPITTPRQEMIGGGVRIKSVIFKDNPNPLTNASKQVNYEYVMENDTLKSSGVVDGDIDKFKRNHQVIDYHGLFQDSQSWCPQFGEVRTVYDVTSKGMNVQMSQGNYVGYRHVKVAEVEETILGTEENGYSLYDYSTAFEHQTPSASLALFPQAAPVPNIDYKRGSLLKQRVYENTNSTARIIKEVTNSYDYVEELLYNETVPYITPSSKRQYYETYSQYQLGNASSNIVPRDQNNYPCSVGGFPGQYIPDLKTAFKLGWAKLTETETKDYYYADNQTTTSTDVISKKTYEYSNDNYQVATENSIVDENGQEIYYQTNYYYPIGNSLAGGTSSTVRSLLRDLNKVNEVLETRTTRSVGPPTLGNQEILSTTLSIYNKINNDINLVLPTEVKTAKGSSSTESRIEFHKYDEYDNPLEVSQKDGTHIVYIWGHNKTLPVAKIENATYSQVEALSGFGTNFTITNGLSAAQQATLRSGLANAMVTTFVYNPSVGVTSITDPRGYTSYFTYDEFNRLELVKDKDGKILSENQYHYKN